MRYPVLISALALICLSFPVRSEDEKGTSAGPPNIVFILLDAARADHFSCYGYDKETTPCIDEISRRGVVFLNNFTPATETFDALPLIFSSRYFSKEIFQRDVWQWGVRRESTHSIFSDFDKAQILLPDLLSRNGYRTVIIHDHWWFMPQTDLVKSFDENVKIKTRLEKSPGDKAMVDRSISWIDKNGNRPFFLYLHVMSPHQPYPPKTADRLFIDKGRSGELDEVRRKFKNKQNESARDWTLEELDCLNALYDSNLRHSDTQIVRLYSTLEKKGLADKTLFIITSDHGENLGQHGRLNHGGPPWDSATRVPLIMTWPGSLPAGVRVEGLTESIDIMPTIADLCGLTVPSDKVMDGVTLKTFIKHPERGKEAVYTEKSIRTPQYKYIVSRDALFNVLSDPGEENNLFEESPELANQLAGQHKRFLAPFQDRYQASRRAGGPDYPFFLPLREFSISPRSAFDICDVEKSPKVVMQEISPDKSWVLNKGMHNGGLFCLPARGKPEMITVSIKMPDGKYRASVLVEDLGEIKGSPGDIGLEGRFPPEGEFSAPRVVKKAPGARYCYLHWGDVTVKDELFSIDLSVRSGSTSPFFLHHVRFDPCDPDEDSAEDKLPPPDEDELIERREGLRSLGYL